MATLGSQLDDLAAYLFRETSRRKLAMLIYPPPVERRMTIELPAFSDRLRQGNLRVKQININHLVNEALAARLEDVVEAWADARQEAKRAIAESAGRSVLSATVAADASADVIIWTRVGGAYPFLSIASLSEKLIGKLAATLVVLYPGSLEGKTSFRLLDERDGYQYRADFIRTVNA